MKDLIDEKEIVLLYIPSEELVADMLTKATTGAKFKLSTFVASCLEYPLRKIRSED